MAYETIKYEVENTIATILLNRPERRNAVNSQLIKELGRAIHEAKDDDRIRVVILTGEGTCFCSGVDLAFEPDPETAHFSAEDSLKKIYKPVLLDIAEMKKPVISAVNGPAVGIGAAFAMICDLSIMAEDAYIKLAFSNIGTIPDCGATWLLVQAAGYRRAYQLAIEAEKINASRCLELGLANKVVTAESLMKETKSLAEKLSGRAPLSLAYTKKVMRQIPQTSFSDTISLEAEYQNHCLKSKDFEEGVTAFLEKREPDFTGN